MTILFWIIIGIDSLILILHYISSIETAYKHKFFSKIKTSAKTNSKNIKESTPKNKTGQFIYELLTIITGILFIVFIFSIIWLPILMFCVYGWKWALISLFIVLALWSLLMILMYKKYVPGFVLKEGAIITNAIYITFYILMSLFVIYYPLFPLNQTIETIYYQSINLNFTLSILIPVLIIGLMITNVYLFINGLYYFVDKDKRIIKARTKLIHILTIFTLTSFVSLFYIVDREWIFLNPENTLRFYEVVDIFKIVLASLLAPLVISWFIGKASKDTNEELDLALDEVNQIEDEVNQIEEEIEE